MPRASTFTDCKSRLGEADNSCLPDWPDTTVVERGLREDIYEGGAVDFSPAPEGVGGDGNERRTGATLSGEGGEHEARWTPDYAKLMSAS